MGFRFALLCPFETDQTAIRTRQAQREREFLPGSLPACNFGFCGEPAWYTLVSEVNLTGSTWLPLSRSCVRTDAGDAMPHRVGSGVPGAAKGVMLARRLKDGLYNLDVKNAAMPSRIRRRVPWQSRIMAGFAGRTAPEGVAYSNHFIESAAPCFPSVSSVLVSIPHVGARMIS